MACELELQVEEMGVDGFLTVSEGARSANKPGNLLKLKVSQAFDPKRGIVSLIAVSLYCFFGLHA